MFDEYDDYSGFMFTPEAADYGGVMNTDYLYSSPSYTDFTYSDYYPTYDEYVPTYEDIAASGFTGSMFSPESIYSMTSAPTYDSSLWSETTPPSFRVDDFLALTPEAGAAGGIFGTSPTDFLNISELIQPSLAQTELLSVNPFSGENDSWMSTGLNYLNPDLDRLSAILGVNRGDLSFRDASDLANSAYDYALLESQMLPREAQSLTARQAAQAAGTAKKAASQERQTGALEKALKAAELATLLYKAGTAKQGIDRSAVERTDAVRDIGPSFERAQAKRGAR